MPTRTLTRRFTALSLALLVIGTFLIGLLVRIHEIRQLERQAEEQNVVLTHIAARVIETQMRDLLASPQVMPGGPQLDDIDRLFKQWLPHSAIARIKFYDTRGVTRYSSDRSQIGEDKRGNPGFIAASEGRVYSELTHRLQFSATEGERHAVDLLASYIPVSDSGKIFAVFELYQDVTPLISQLDSTLWQVWLIAGSVLALIFLAQRQALRKAQTAILDQETRLENSNRELEANFRERNRQLEELRYEQQLIFDNAQVGILLLQKRRVIKCNQRIADMFGYASPEDLHGESTEIFYPTHEAYLAAGRTGYSQLAEYGHADFEVEMRCRNGQAIWIIQSGRPLKGDKVLDAPSIWVYTDITERRRAEAERNIAAAAFESQEGMLVTDAECRILRVNKAFSETTGYAAEEVIGKKPSILRSNRHDEAFFKAMWQSINETGFWQGEIWDRRRNGEIYPKWLTISAVKDLSGRVTHYVGTHTDITERKANEERIRNLAFFDQLTGLPNRTLLLDRLRQAVHATARDGTHGAVVFVDLDHFKSINDTLGHDHGDLLLQQVASTLSTNVRQCDTVARLGGDEFILVLLGLESSLIEAATQVEAICRKLLAALNGSFVLKGSECHNSASMGATLFGGQASNTDELLKQADLALYKSKEAGRNAFTFFDPSMEASVLARTRIDNELRHAIQNREFVLHYQPLVDGHDTRIVGAEALIRWQHPVRGQVSPNEFIPAAENLGLIVPIGHWVIAEACGQLARWGKNPATAHLTLSVNVSVQQFRQPDFAEDVLALLNASGADPSRLKLELTESLFVENVDDIIRKMSRLRSQGVSFSLDDFGTGYSSLANLGRLPLDQLKIDRSFVADLIENEHNLAICIATINLAHTLRLKVVAEGIEDEAQHYILTTVHHCDLLQGYFYGRPMPLEKFEERLSGVIPPAGPSQEQEHADRLTEQPG